MKRYTTIPNTNVILDNLTGEKISFKKNTIIKILNQLNDKNDEIATELYNNKMEETEIRRILKKYNIHDSKKLDQCLLNQRTW